jgi:hypothetical protein
LLTPLLPQRRSDEGVSSRHVFAAKLPKKAQRYACDIKIAFAPLGKIIAFPRD